jgi:hypothetical protein
MMRQALLIVFVGLVLCAPLQARRARARDDALAPQPIYRCLGPDGSTMFSGTPCNQDSLAQGALPEVAAIGDRTPLHLCPLDPDELRARVADAFLAHDINRLAGLMLWQGYGKRAAIARMQALSSAMRQGLLAIDLRSRASPLAPVAEPGAFFGGDAGMAVRGNGPDLADGDAPVPTHLRISLDGGHELSLPIAGDHGCWWLLP